MDETFAIYGRHFRYWIALVAVVHVPVTLASVGLVQLSGGVAMTVFIALLNVMGATFAYGAAVYGVGQHYVTGGVVIRDCYTRVWWRARSLVVLGLLASLVWAALLFQPSYEEQPLLATLVVFAFPLAIVIGIYWFVAIQAVVVEGHRVVPSLRRSFALVSGSWWRVFGLALTMALVAFGLGIVTIAPVAVISWISGAGLDSGFMTVAIAVGRILVSVVVPPVLLIGWTLLYYDMRVRKEEYDVAALSRELGIVAT